jgi:SAM-dependent methyltransferase
MCEGSDHPLVAALYDTVTAPLERFGVRPHREYLARDLWGPVLDLGAGTGAMFPYFRASGTEATKVVATEPDRHMRKRAVSKAEELGFEVEVRGAPAEELPFPDGHFETVVASMVFCTIGDVEAALSEVRRVLEPGGELRFLEHVRADGWRERLQEFVAPVWKRVAGGCHVNRRTGATLAAHPGFDVVEMDRLDFGVPPAWPFVRGRVRRRSRLSRSP